MLINVFAKSMINFDPLGRAAQIKRNAGFGRQRGGGCDR
jgi:hypothetical protein